MQIPASPAGSPSAPTPADPRPISAAAAANIGRVTPNPLRTQPVAPDATLEAARQFESLLVTQLLQVMRRAGGDTMTGPGADTYGSMMDEAMAGHLAKSGGFGLADVLSRALGAEQGAIIPSSVPTEAPRLGSPGHTEGLDLDGVGQRIADAAREVVGLNPARWGRAGRLSRADLGSTLVTPAREGDARFNVEDAAGFQDDYKCNLFAFEVARRAGYAVPVVARERGWGYLGPDGVVLDAADGTLRNGWGRVATGETAASLDAGLQSGQRAFLLAGSGTDGHAGHMAVVGRIHAIDYAEDGGIARIEFEGWEARPNGAGALPERVWARAGNPVRGARNALGRIELIELSEPAVAARNEILLSRSAPASVHDER